MFLEMMFFQENLGLLFSENLYRSRAGLVCNSKHTCYAEQRNKTKDHFESLISCQL